MNHDHEIFLDHEIVHGHADSMEASDLARRIESDLLAAFRNSGWKVRPLSKERDRGADLRASCDGEDVVVTVKVSSRATRNLLEAMLATAAVTARKAAQELHGSPVAIVGAEVISRKMAESLRAFGERYLADDVAAFGWIDARGRLQLHGSPALSAVRLKRRAPQAASVRTVPSKHSAFSDLGQWLLKVLIAPSIRSNLLTAPREQPENLRHLAHLAQVSVPTAQRMVTTAKEEGLVQQTSAGISIVEPKMLLHRWRQKAGEPKKEMRAKWILRKRDSAAALKDALAKIKSNGRDRKPRLPDACLGLFAASDVLGVGFVEGVAPHLLVKRLSAERLEAFGLREASVGEDADVFVFQPSAPESTFRGAVRHDHYWASDILQTWLDASLSGARGQEQADYIERQVLVPAFRGSRK